MLDQTSEGNRGIAESLAGCTGISIEHIAFEDYSHYTSYALLCT